jgi:hypothetical protein
MESFDLEIWPEKALVDKVITYLNNPEDRRGVWRGLTFMEVKGVEVSLRYGELHAYLTDPNESPVPNPEGLTRSQERQLVLALRQSIREQAGLQLIDDVEMVMWKYEPPVEPPSWRPDQLVSRVWADTYKPSEDELRSVKSRLKEQHPEIVRAIELFSRQNRASKATSDIPLSTFWICGPLTGLLSRMLPHLEASGVRNVMNAVLDSTDD